MDRLLGLKFQLIFLLRTIDITSLMELLFLLFYLFTKRYSYIIYFYVFFMRSDGISK